MMDPTGAAPAQAPGERAVGVCAHGAGLPVQCWYADILRDSIRYAGHGVRVLPRGASSASVGVLRVKLNEDRPEAAEVTLDMGEKERLMLDASWVIVHTSETCGLGLKAAV